MSTQDPCTALMKYEPRRFQVMRAQSVCVNGHHFRRVAGWLCACGMRRPRRFVLADLPPCTVLPD